VFSVGFSLGFCTPLFLGGISPEFAREICTGNEAHILPRNRIRFLRWDLDGEMERRESEFIGNNCILFKHNCNCWRPLVFLLRNLFLLSVVGCSIHTCSTCYVRGYSFNSFYSFFPESIYLSNTEGGETYMFFQPFTIVRMPLFIWDDMIRFRMDV
jgi:hypothetical protein